MNLNIGKFSVNENKKKSKVAFLLLLISLFFVASCAGYYRQQPDNQPIEETEVGQDFKVVTLKSNNSGEIECVIWRFGGSFGGISCNWDK